MKVYEVGGCVRDELMGVKPMDRDWVVVNSSPAEMEHKGFKPIGKDFPVFLHPVTKEEYALARTEKKSGTGYKDFTFYFDKNVTLEEDLQRRDLTINAMAKDSNGEIIDPFGGMKDIQQQIFRHTSPAFAEDPLRALRLARLKSYPHLSKFSTAIETTKLIQDIVMSDELSALSADRVWMEVSKALANKDSKNFFESLLEHRLLTPWFIGLASVSQDGASPEYKWAEMQRVNNFELCQKLPIPNNFKKVAGLLQSIMELVECTEFDDKLKMVESLNFSRNHHELEILFKFSILQTHSQNLNLIKDAVLKIDFAQLANIPGHAVSERKKFLYHEALKSII
ncbi:tRNA nucleotidyl transferase [Gammaproteobacteria bacterium]|nr:tRNA nucleotidyl transferase [Gammaproteobacteria bacterium]MDA9049048.1 tRNA nucleotidyl transferase [Gammaproteobacteria bacterium]MDA9365231.1 tRNA nucleotidyl transferase [Gammaproteobacteria bacterium]MDA9974040.1 tRNA nucleotidyl transferase [Gammaproteobacteria bacterium]MDB9700159.1 tRNA nucleotidyl transferase [Gammaproteobacteria bacterium]|tara:strand:- start:12611 stop:13627 length:1017 start_codon:yes stop_codon:yes gene_type:complete